jgi:hypothetical protein
MLIKPPSRTDLHTAYESPGCPVCTLLARSERRYIDMALYEHVSDVKWRAEVRAARGFCALHTEHVLKSGRSALGVSLVTADILQTLRDMLGTSGGGTSPLDRVRSALGAGQATSPLRPQQPCPICRYLGDLSAIYVAALLDDLAGDAGQAAYERSAGLCVPHLIAAVEHGGSGLKPLKLHQERVWVQLESELNEFIRKSDYQYSGEAMTDAERDAWRRALRLLAGNEF